MGIWVRTPDLEKTETVVWNRAANRTQSSGRAVGGRLYLTQSRLAFEPNRLDAVTRGRPWQTPLGAIAAVGSQAPDGKAPDGKAPGGKAQSGGLRTRLRLDLSDGSVELFVVSRPDEVVKAIKGAAGLPG
jgi:hypothetical protein